MDGAKGYLKRAATRLTKKSAQANAILGRLFHNARQTDRTLAGANHHAIVRGGKFTADRANHAAGSEPEDQEQHPRYRGVKSQEETAEIHPQRVLEDQQAESAIGALPHRITEDGARVGGIELVIDPEPQSDHYPSEKREAEHQDLLFRRKVKQEMPVLNGACVVGDLKGERGQDQVRQSVQSTGAPLVTKHSGSG